MMIGWYVLFCWEGMSAVVNVEAPEAYMTVVPHECKLAFQSSVNVAVHKYGKRTVTAHLDASERFQNMSRYFAAIASVRGQGATLQLRVPPLPSCWGSACLLPERRLIRRPLAQPTCSALSKAPPLRAPRRRPGRTATARAESQAP